MDNHSPEKRRYTPGEVAQTVEDLIDQMKLRPHTITEEELAMWEAFPAQIRAHRYPFIFMDPDRPIIEYLQTGVIGPNAPFTPTTTH